MLKVIQAESRMFVSCLESLIGLTPRARLELEEKEFCWIRVLNC